MAQKIFSIVAGLSLWFCVAACIFWLRSRSIGDEFTLGQQSDAKLELRQLELAFAPFGRLSMRWDHRKFHSVESYYAHRGDGTTPFWLTYEHLRDRPDPTADVPQDREHRAGRLRWGWMQYHNNRYTLGWLVIPLWVVVGVLAILPAGYGLRRFMARRGAA